MVSILIGSGFSIPEGVRSVQDLNERLRSIDASEIYVHSDQTAFFLEDKESENDYLKYPERNFVEGFLDFYNREILEEDDDFHYEDFYDFYTAFLREEKNAEAIQGFCDQFNTELPKLEAKRDSYNRIRDFNITFNQLVGSLLENPSYYKDVGLGNYPPYDNFIAFLRNRLQNQEVKVHSLNHDLFFEHIAGKVSGLWEHFCDGFELQGSKIYGLLRREFQNKQQRIHKEYKVKLRRFTGDFSDRLALYKLHGSIDNYIAYELGSKLRLKRDYGISEFYFEHKPEGSEKYTMSRLNDSIYPDFLSGTTEKVHYYDNPHYKILFNHFAENLAESDSLLVIGYGFKDQGINSFLKEHYLSRDKKMTVIDINRPNEDLIDPKHYNLIEKSITEVGPEEIESYL